MRTAGSATSFKNNFDKLTNIDKLRDINVVNLRLDYTFDYEPLSLKEGKVFFVVDNIFDKKYAYSLAKNSSGQRAFYYMPGITFMLGMDLKF